METRKNNGYVKVQFTPYGKGYWYMIPDYIEASDVKNYVVVEDAFYQKNRDVAPYKVAKVLTIEAFPCDGAKLATKYIAATIDSEAYVAARDHERIIDDIYDGIINILDSADDKDMVAILATLALFGNDYCQTMANEFIAKNYNKLQRVM